MDGFEVCYRIRQHPALLDTPVIFLSASMTRENKLQAFAAGASDYVTKPFEAEELLAHVTAVLRRHTQSVESSGRVLSFFGVQHQVGTTTLAIQYSEELAIQHAQNVVLIDLAGAEGTVAPQLGLFSTPTIQDVLSQLSVTHDCTRILAQAQRHRANCWVLPATLSDDPSKEQAAQLRTILEALVAADYYVVIDAGATLNALTLCALQQADATYIVAAASAHGRDKLNAFRATAENHQLELDRLHTVSNEMQPDTQNHAHGNTPRTYMQRAYRWQQRSPRLADLGLSPLLAPTF
jgi:Flp pilus assembly CpaE family ATPase